MRFFITGDANAKSGVIDVVSEIGGPTEDHIASNEYGVGLTGVAIVLMCRDPELQFKRRIRFDRKEKVIYFDIMFDYQSMVKLSHAARKKLIGDKICDELKIILGKYEIPDFDKSRLSLDVGCWLEKIGMRSCITH